MRVLEMIFYIGIIAVITSLSFSVVYLSSKIKDLQYSLKSQNEAILKQKLDLKKYYEEKAKTDAKIITKYKNVYLKDNTCEAKLNEINNVTNLYYSSWGV